MEWIILFIVSWILFFLLIDWKQLRINIWGGLMAVILQMLVDSQAISHGYYEIHKNSFNLLGSSAFFVLGPVFVIGVLLAQYFPIKRWIMIVNIVILTSLYSLQELWLQKTGALVYTNWHYIDSVVVNVSAMIFLSWFSIVVLKKVRWIQ